MTKPQSLSIPLSRDTERIDQYAPGQDLYSLELASLSRASQTPDIGPLWTALNRIVGRQIGHSFLTLMRYDEPARELVRICSSHPTAFPIGGRKAVSGAAWEERVIERGETLFGADEDDMRATFSDYASLFALGLCSFINSPVLFRRKCLGSLNAFAPRNSLKEDDCDILRSLSYLFIPVLLTESHTSNRQHAVDTKGYLHTSETQPKNGWLR